MNKKHPKVQKKEENNQSNKIRNLIKLLCHFCKKPEYYKKECSKCNAWLERK